MITIDGYRVDISISEEYFYASEISSYPVEEGADITDHVRALPLSMRIEGVVSDTPLSNVTRNGAIPSAEMFERLKEIHATREPVIVETDKGIFPDMQLESFSVPVDVGIGEALRFSATFRQLELVTNDRATVLVSIDRAARSKNLGAKEAAAVTQVPKVRPDREALLRYTRKCKVQPNDQGVTSAPDGRLKVSRFPELAPSSSPVLQRARERTLL